MSCESRLQPGPGSQGPSGQTHLRIRRSTRRLWRLGWDRLKGDPNIYAIDRDIKMEGPRCILFIAGLIGACEHFREHFHLPLPYSAHRCDALIF